MNGGIENVIDLMMALDKRSRSPKFEQIFFNVWLWHTSTRKNITNCTENSATFLCDYLCQKMNCHDWTKDLHFKGNHKIAIHSNLVNLTVECWRWMLLGCGWQISGGLDFEPYTAIISLHLNENRQCSVTVFSYLLQLCKSWSDLPHRCHLSLRPATPRTLQTAREATISPQTEPSAKGSRPSPSIFLLYRLCVH